MTTETTLKEKRAKAVQKLSAGAELLRKLAKPAVAFLTYAIPLCIVNGRRIREAYYALPSNMLQFQLGLIFCFFGGLYPVLFAAFQAAEYTGRQALRAASKDIGDEVLKIIEESKKDDTTETVKALKAGTGTNNDRAYWKHKTQLVLRKMDPEKLDTAVSTMYAVWLSVAAVLTIQFARTIASALSIADFLKRPVNRFIAPVLVMAVPEDYQRWVPVILGWLCKSIAMSIAWYIEAIRSAFASALYGGLLMARSTLYMVQKRGYFQNKHHSEIWFDELLSYIFAACGFYFQFRLGFDVPYPFNLILFPFEIAEYYIRWSITK